MYLKLQLAPKRKYTLLSSWVLKTEEGQIETGGCATPTIELVHTWPSLILKLKNEAWSSLDQLIGGYGAPSTFPLAPWLLSTWLWCKCIPPFGADHIIAHKMVENIDIAKYNYSFLYDIL